MEVAVNRPYDALSSNIDFRNRVKDHPVSLIEVDLMLVSSVNSHNWNFILLGNPLVPLPFLLLLALLAGLNLVPVLVYLYVLRVR